MENFDESSKFKKNILKNQIKNILNSFGSESKNIFSELVHQNLNDNANIKYIIKIITHYTKKDINQEMKNKCYELFMELIKTLSKNNIIANLTNILLYMQENITNFEIHILFEILLNKLNEIEMKTFEILNGFCLINMKKETESKVFQKESLLCYQSLIKNYEKLIDNSIKDRVKKSFLDTTINIILDKNILFGDKFVSLKIINDIICVSQENIQNYATKIVSEIIQELSLNDENIKIIILNIINNIIKYCPNKKGEIKNIISSYLNELNNDKLNDNSFKRIVYDINTKLEFNNKEKFQNIKTKKINSNRSFNFKNQYFRENFKKGNKSSEKNESNHNKNIKCEIYVNEKSVPLNNFTKNQKKNDSFNKDKLILSTFRKEEDFVNPIKLWYDFDTNNSNKYSNKNNNICSIQVNQTINNNINILNQIKEESKLDLIINEIMKISNNQNIIAEQIINLDKNTKKQISYFDERLNQLENKEINDELINKRVRILYPSNNANKKITEFITSNDNDKSIYFLNSITEEEIELIDNNLIEDVIDKLIFFIRNKIFIKESINFLKKLFVKNKKRFNLDTYKKILVGFDILLKSNLELNNQISFDISFIISIINSEKI